MVCAWEASLKAKQTMSVILKLERWQFVFKMGNGETWGIAHQRLLYLVSVSPGMPGAVEGSGAGISKRHFSLGLQKGTSAPTGPRSQRAAGAAAGGWAGAGAEIGEMARTGVEGRYRGRGKGRL